MVQFSTQILNVFGAPGISDLTKCGAQELPQFPDYLSSAIWNSILGNQHPDAAVVHLDLAFLRRAVAAADEYSMARNDLLRFLQGVEQHQHRLGPYLSALRHFEQCVGSVWQAAELFNRMEHKVQGLKLQKLTLYKPGDNSDLERINKLNNVAKHFSAEQAEKTAAPIWITNIGIESVDASLTFDELHQNVVALFDVARQTFEEIPREAAARRAVTNPEANDA
jgi:hypothetical protein